MTDASMVLAVLCSGLVAGGLTLVALAVVPVFEQLPVADWTRLHRALDGHVDRFMPALTILAIVAGTVAAMLVSGTTLRVLLLAGVVGDVAVALVSQTLNLPLNRAIRGWDPQRTPATAGAIRSRWVRFHRLRTAAGVAATALFTTGLVLAYP
jgi:uncharacterized membrane protein